MFNSVQQQIANHTEGPVLVVAGPGSGKTKTLVDRIVNLVKKGVAPETIIMGTFTEKAVKELITFIFNKLLEDGIKVNVEVKGENMIDNAVVQPKKEYAQQIAAVSKQEYIIVPGKKEKERLVI